MESIRDGDKVISDPHEITAVITKVFRDWFYRSEKDAWRDHGISDAVIGNDRDRFLEIAGPLKSPPTSRRRYGKVVPSKQSPRVPKRIWMPKMTTPRHTRSSPVSLGAPTLDLQADIVG